MRPGRQELGRTLREAGILPADWLPTFAAVDRALFLPDLMWPYDTRLGASVPVDRTTNPDIWYQAADTDAPIVTQWDDGEHSGQEPGTVPTSSSSMPSVVYSMLNDLEVDGGMRVLDVGTGTGETAGALAHRCGSRNVATIEVDRGVSMAARERLCGAGLYPDVIVGDGYEGCADKAPYDRVLVTAGLRATISHRWIEQTRQGGLILAPWGTHYSHADAVARLVVRDGTASGRFTRPVEFMKFRAQRLSRRQHGEYVPNGAEGNSEVSSTAVTEAEFVTAPYAALPFALGLRVKDCTQVVAEKRDGVRPVWFYSLTDRSWACVMFRDGEGQAKVWQAGSRRLWDDIEAAFHWWQANGKPSHERFGLTVTPEGQFGWLDDPAASWAV